MRNEDLAQLQAGNPRDLLASKQKQRTSSMSGRFSAHQGWCNTLTMTVHILSLHTITLPLVFYMKQIRTTSVYTTAMQNCKMRVQECESHMFKIHTTTYMREEHAGFSRHFKMLPARYRDVIPPQHFVEE
jgi:hypothetical protein